jgi:transcriptional regulator with XRE-family HTH domain
MTPTLTDQIRGKRLRKLRIESGLTVAAFADSVGLRYRQWENMERGSQKITMDIYAQIGEKYPDRMAWLLFEGYSIKLSEAERASLDALVSRLLAEDGR